jgi:hypothetical protein
MGLSFLTELEDMTIIDKCLIPTMILAYNMIRVHLSILTDICTKIGDQYTMNVRTSQDTIGHLTQDSKEASFHTNLPPLFLGIDSIMNPDLHSPGTLKGQIAEVLDMKNWIVAGVM